MPALQNLVKALLKKYKLKNYDLSHLFWWAASGPWIQMGNNDSQKKKKKKEIVLLSSDE
jgi:hypothetical protein